MSYEGLNAIRERIRRMKDEPLSAKKFIELRGLIEHGIIAAIDGVYMSKEPILKEVDTVNIALAIHDSIYVELKKDLERIALILEEILKEVKK